MKRTLSILLAALLLVTMLPLSVGAEEATSERERLMALACEVFPEYADVIAADQAPAENRLRSIEKPTVVFTETRKVSNDEYITYTELSNGIVTLVDLATDPTLTYVSEHMTGTSTSYTATLTGTAPGSMQTFKATGVRFTIYNSSYDRVISTGTPKVINPNNTIYAEGDEIIVTRNEYETATTAAMAYYKFPIIFGTTDYDGVFTLSIMNNRTTVDYFVE